MDEVKVNTDDVIMETNDNHHSSYTTNDEKQQQYDVTNSNLSTVSKQLLLSSSSSSTTMKIEKTTTTTTTTEKTGSADGGGGGQQQQNQQSYSNDEFDIVVLPPPNQNHRAKSDSEVKKDESRLHKILMRVWYGAILFIGFCCTVYLGHVYICFLVALIETLVFRELVRVRYSAYFDRIQDTIPFFRTTQWLWYIVAIFYTYGDFLSEIIQNNQQLHYLLHYTQLVPSISFLLYSGTFVVTISTLQRDHIKFQMNQLCWTMLVLLVTVGQLKYIMHNVFNGLIWFVLPCLLVFANDIMAYVTGMLYGRKFIHKPFISFSPNKTWEGFIGGCVFTLVAAWHVSKFLAKFHWMVCPMNEFNLYPPESIQCQLDPIFLPTKVFFPSQVFDLVPTWVVKIIFSPNTVVNICSVIGTKNMEHDFGIGYDNNNNSHQTILTPCISGEKSHLHHHFELNVSEYYPIQLHAVWLALFASLVAPFGGFLASAMKRAYGIKDFDSLIPGHGGVMDRMDCQFLMALCTWVHYNTFVKFATVSVPKLKYMYTLLSEQEQMEFLRDIMEDTYNTGTDGNTKWISTENFH